MSTEKPTGPAAWNEGTSRIFIDYGRYFVPERAQQMQIIGALLSCLEGPAVVLDFAAGKGFLLRCSW